eukprot:753370-Hanusia_phi.AAC.11
MGVKLKSLVALILGVGGSSGRTPVVDGDLSLFEVLHNETLRVCNGHNQRTGAMGRVILGCASEL